ncbi:homeobox-domain-containing protein [Clavulina sp. PMI_390]|nr:homeobox-domain-containing protein [Clavulina sp. PMI_390]
MANNPPPSSFHLDETRMLTRSRRLNTHPGQSSAPSTSSAPVLGPGGGPAGSNFPTSDTQHSRGGRDSDASASGASSFGPERTSRSVGSTSPIASTSRSGGGSNINPVTGKRKRSRVSPAQLTTLERIFLKDRSPTAAKRKELAEQLGMNERQTQVWFQNRRAKAKLLEQRARAGRPPARTDNSGSSSGASFGPNAGLGEVDADALRRIHEDGNVFIIPSTDLCIGTFRRVSAGLNDLIGYTSDSKRVLAWYIYSAGTGFKMEVSLDNIVSVEMTEDAMQAHSRATIHLSGPPSFYREFVSPGDPYGDMGLATRQWQRSDDWTENRQGTLCLVHTVVARTAAIEYAFAAWLPQRDFSPEDGAGSDADAESSARGAAAHSPSLRRSRHGSEASALTSPMATIQTPSLLGVLPSPAPPSSYRDPILICIRS